MRMRSLRQRLGAFALVIAMVLPMLSIGTPVLAAPAAARPQLFVDFLGDNETAPNTYSGAISAPHNTDQSQAADPDNPWDLYNATESAEKPIFWVGVGINNMAQFELAQKGGLYSVELGFYYNSEIVKPYTGGDYKATLQAYNISAAPDGKNQWSSDYEIVEAVESAKTTPGRVISDELTREYEPDAAWDLTYVSLRKTGTGENRFIDADPADTSTQYVMMIPFQVQKYGVPGELCFRLARDASLLSIGSGETGYTLGDKPNTETGGYGAWERVTRNENHNLKEMLNFTGDLDIFSGDKHKDDELTARLTNDGLNFAANNVTMTRSGDINSPAVTAPSGGVLGGLYPGSIVDIQTGCAPGTVVKVTVTGTTVGNVTVNELDASKHYTFQMPNENVTVRVDFYPDPGNTQYNATLSILHPDGEPDDSDPLGKNTARMTDGTVAVPSGSAPNINWRIENIQVNNTVTVEITNLHPDYDVELIGRAGLQTFMLREEEKNKKYTFDMPSSNVTVEVTFRRAELHEVNLLVDMKNESTGSKDNLAMMSYRDWGWTADSTNADDWGAKTNLLNGLIGGDEHHRDPLTGAEIIGVRSGRELTVSVAVVKGYSAKLEIMKKPSADEKTWVRETIDLMAMDPRRTAWAGAALTADATLLEGKFPMPECTTEVKVTFEKAEIRRVYATAVGNVGASPDFFTVTGTDDFGLKDVASKETPNYKSYMTGTQIYVDLMENDPPDTTKRQGQLTVADRHISKVEVRRVTKVNPDGSFVYGDTVSCSGSTLNDNISFILPVGADVEVKVFYELGEVKAHTATLHMEHPAGTSSADQSVGWWDDNGTRVSPTINAKNGDALKARVEVRSGWHIKSVRVVGAAGSYYAYTLSGNGWNNGMVDADGDPVELLETLDLTMPDEDIHVYVEMARGIPEVGYTAGVHVEDPDNTSSPLADNWAQISVDGGATYVPTPHVVGGGTHTEPARVGDEVYVRFHCGTDFYLEKIELTPGSAGALTWVDSNTVKYIQGAMDTKVIVTFTKDKNKAIRQVKLLLMDAQGNDGAELKNNNPAIAAPDNMTNVHEGIIKAFAGDTIAIDALADTNRYVVKVMALEGGNLQPITPALPTGQGSGNQAGSFLMPSGNVAVYVYFSDEPWNGERGVALTVTDLSGGAVGEAGSAEMTRSGSANSVTAKSQEGPKLLPVKAGETVKVTVTLEPGYSIESIIGSPAGVLSLANSMVGGKRVVTFTMPNQDAAVEVRLHKGNPTKYTANIVLHAPDGVPPLTAGDAWFRKDAQGLSVYSVTAEPGEELKVHIAAKPGWLLESVVVAPEELGVETVLSGVYGREEADFVMPAGNVQVNVTFKRGWPDNGEINAGLFVYGPDGSGSATLSDTGSGATTAPVAPGGSETIAARDGDAMEVALTPAAGYTVDSVHITDAAGKSVTYQYGTAGNILFDMPGSPTKVEVTYRAGEAEEHKATLTYTSGGSAVLKNEDTGSSTSANNSSVNGKQGETLTLTAAPDAGYYLAGVLVTAADGAAIALDGPIAADVATLAMQDQDITVHAIFAAEEAGKYAAVLQLAGPAGAGTGVIAAGGASTSVTNCPGGGSVNAAADDAVTVTATANPGYVIDTVKITNANGDPVSFTWTGADQVSFAMPAFGALAVVTFREEAADAQYTAQVIVDNGGGAGNSAKLHRDGGSEEDILRDVKAGEKLKVEIRPVTGYLIDLVMAVPSKWGVTLTGMTLAPDQDQTLEFYMPSGDVQVFVRFVRDRELTYTARLTVDHGTVPGTSPVQELSPDPQNVAYIKSGRSGERGPVIDRDCPLPQPTGTSTQESVIAANAETVTVTAKPKSGYRAVIKTKDALGAELTITGLVMSKKTATETVWQFPMPAQEVNLTVTFEVGEPEKHNVYLHIDPATGGAAKVTNTADSTYTDVDMGVIQAPEGETVKVEAQALPTTYIKAAYVMVNGVVVLDYIASNRAGTLDAIDEDFLMQPNDVHVYVVFEDIADKPTDQEYAAVLTVIDLVNANPGNDPTKVGLAGSAFLRRASDGEETPVLQSNSKTVYTKADGSELVVNEHAALTAPENDTVTVIVSVEPGYAIDSIILTPLAKAIMAVPTGNPNEYSFTMPAHNVGVEVRLGKGSEDGIYDVRLHFIAPVDATQTTLPVLDGNTGNISYGSQKVDESNYTTDKLRVLNGMTVDVKAGPGDGYYIKKAYVLYNAGTRMLDLKPNALEGSKRGAGEPEVIFPATFKMPASNTDVYLEFAPGEPPEETNYTAGIIMTEASGLVLYDNTVTMTRSGDPGDSVSVTCNSPHDQDEDTFNLEAGETITFILSIQDTYEVDEIVVSPAGAGGVDIHPIQDTVDPNKYTFTMPDWDVMTHVKLKTAGPVTYKATLRVVDRSGSLNNVVSMNYDGSGMADVQGNGAVITDLAGTERIRLSVTPDVHVRIAEVIVRDNKTGSSIITATGTVTGGVTNFPYRMDLADVEITVILEDDTAETLYTAGVKIEDPDGVPGSSVSISNPTSPALPKGDLWTRARETDTVRVDFKAPTGYIAIVTAKTVPGNDSLSVLQMGTESGYAIVSMPAADIQFTVEFTKDKDRLTPVDVSLVIAGYYDDGHNGYAEATLEKEGGTPSVTVKGDAPAPKTLNALTPDDRLDLTAKPTSNAHVVSATVSVDGVAAAIPLAGNAGELITPTGDATVTVTFAEGEQSARPYDPNYDNTKTQYIPGYLSGLNTDGALRTVVNEGKGVATITVPTLYDIHGSLSNADRVEKYKLYYFDGVSYKLLTPEVDYALLDDPYQTDEYYTGYQGARFGIRSLIPGSPLSQYLAYGGVIYITSTETGLTESEFVDVVIPADPDLGKHRATLIIVDPEGVATTNTVILGDGVNSVNTSGDSLTGLDGTELLKTVLSLPVGAKLVSVTATDSSGTKLISEDPATTGRYPYLMKNEDVVITVTLKADDTPDFYTAAVSLDGHQNKPNNTATIHNTTLPGAMPEGSIWAVGYVTNEMTITVSTEPGFYATVVAVEKSTGRRVGVVTTGIGGDATNVVTFPAYLQMPADDVDITVHYSTVLPPKADNDLTLKMEGPAGFEAQAGNTATVMEMPDILARVYGSSTAPVLSANSARKIRVGSSLDLLTTAGSGYFVKTVTVRLYDEHDTAVLTTYTLTLDGNGKVSFPMPYNDGKVEVVVTYDEPEQTARPFDPDNDITSPTDPAVKTARDGYILARNLGTNAGGLPQAEVIVPVLTPDDGETPGSFQNATPDIAYKFYVKDAFGYQPLAGKMTVSSVTAVTDTSGGVTRTTAAKMTLTANSASLTNEAALLMKKGGKFYITAEDVGATPAKESRYTEVEIAASYTATLHIAGNDLAEIASGVRMEAVGTGKAVTADGQVITGLNGGEDLAATVTLDPGERIAAVIVTEEDGGSRTLPVPASSADPYSYTMVKQDVDITVLLAPSDESKTTYVATVRKVYDPASTTPLSGNNASVANSTTLGLPAGNIWAAGYENDHMVVSVKTLPGWYAIVTAVQEGTETVVPSIQWDVTGVFDAELDMPAANVDVKVTFSQTKPAPGALTLKVDGAHDGLAANWAKLDWTGHFLNANGNAPTSSSELVDAGTALALTSGHDATHHVYGAGVQVGSMNIAMVLTDGAASLKMPYVPADATDGAVITVTFAQGVQSARPYDPDHAAAPGPGTMPGWIQAMNLGGGKLDITVPVLYPGDGTDPYQDALESYGYELYLKTGSTFTKLMRGVDYTERQSTREPDTYYGSYTGTKLHYEALSTRMKNFLANGGTLYITAQKMDEGESEKTEVLVQARGKDCNVTLRIVDHSSSIGSKVELTDGLVTVNTDGSSFVTGGHSNLTTTVTPDSFTEVKAVLATTAGGSFRLPLTGGSYPWAMTDEDVTITVILDNSQDSEKIYTAVLEKAGDDGLAGNHAEVENTTNPVLPHGTTWTSAHAGDTVLVKVTTEPGYYAVIAAKNRTTGAEVAGGVLQMGNQSTAAGPVTGYFTMPAADVDITVTYSKAAQAGDWNFSLTETQSGGTSTLTVNTTSDLIQVTDGGNAPILHVDGANTIATLLSPPLTGQLKIVARPETGFRVLSVTLRKGGITVPVELDFDGVDSYSKTLPMPLKGADVVVTYTNASEPPRPYDPAQKTGYDPYIEGYLKGENLGSGQFVVKVPNLFTKLDPADTIYNATDARKLTFYTFDGVNYNMLTTISSAATDVDYDADHPDYEVVDAKTYVHTENSVDYTGKILTLHVMKGESALAQAVRDGGVIYITSTTDLGESEYVEVVLTADPDKGRHTARIQIDDPLNDPGNSAVLKAENADVKVSGHGDFDSITGLQGTEQLKTVVTVAPGARLLGVTVTEAESGSTYWLDELPKVTGTSTDPKRYPYFMHNEDVTVIVHFAEDDDVYIATVNKTGATAVAGNGATVENALRSNLSKGVIWAAGYERDDMRVTVTTAAGYYAKVSAVREDTGAAVSVYPTGGGDGVSFYSIATMPNSNVQITVDFTTERPDNWEAPLTLSMAGAYSADAGNYAQLAASNGSISLAVNGAGPVSDTANNVATNTDLKLTTAAVAGNYVEKAQIERDSAGHGPTTPVVIDLDNTGKGDVRQYLGGMEVKVYYKTGDRTPRPFEPGHNPARPGEPSSQDGWLQAKPEKDINGNRLDDTVRVTIPVLSDTGAPMEDADNTQFRFYVKTATNYVELVQGTDIALGTVEPVNNRYGDSDHNGVTFTLKALPTAPGSTAPIKLLRHYMKEGGTVYVTATKPDATGTARGESRYTELVISANRTARLKVEEQLGLTGGNIAWMTDTVGGTSIMADAAAGAEITGLMGTETLRTDVYRLSSDAKLVNIVATTSSGSVTLANDGSGNYDYTMANEDVTITSVFSKKDVEWYIATVTKSGDGGLMGNDAEIVDADRTTVDGRIWAAGYKDDTMEVTVTTEPGWYAVVTAKRKGSATNDVPVVQYGTSGSFPVRFIMPASDVEVLVEYTTTPPEPGDLTLTVKDAAGAANTGDAATVTPFTLTAVVDGVNHTKTETDVTAGTALPMTFAPATGRRVKSTQMKVAGFPTPITIARLGNGTDPSDLPVMPLANATIEGVFEDGVTTPRPYDPDHDPVTAGDEGTQSGWLLSQNPGNRQLIITVPTLYLDNSGNLPENAYYTPVTDIYQLYWKNAMGIYTKLVWDTDLKLIGTGAKVTNTYAGNTYEGISFIIQAESGANPYLLDVLDNGGRLYITATKPSDASVNYGESDWTQIVVPTAEEVEMYDLTLHIIDTSPNPAGNKVELKDATGVGTLTNDGDTVEVGAGVNLTTTITALDANTVIRGGVATTASGGSTYLSTTDVTLPMVYANSMPNENMDVTVVFGAKDEEEFLVIVKKDDQTATGVTDTPTIENTTTPTMSKGVIWTLAKAGDDLKVSFDAGTAYAVVTAETVSGAPVGVYQTAFTGAGSAVLKMVNPGESITVTVTYTDDALTADLELGLHGYGDDTKTGNTAKASDETNGGMPDIAVTGANGDSTGADFTVKDDSAWSAGSKVKVETSQEAGYYVKNITVTTASGYVLTLTPDVHGVANFIMQAEDVKVMVNFEEGTRSPRPYDPEHKTVPEAGKPGTQAGWIEGTNKGDNSATVIIPTLIDTTEKVPEGLKDVPMGVGDPAKDTEFNFYIYNTTTLEYDKLGPGTDYKLSTPFVTGTTTYGGNTYANVTFDIEALTNDLQEKFEDGVTLYVTATVPKGSYNDADTNWVESHMTELIIPEAAGGLAPYDPENVDAADDKYADHWLRAENRGDYLIVTVDMLNKADGSTPTSVTWDSGVKEDTFKFYLQDPADAEKYSDLSDVIELTRPDDAPDATATDPTEYWLMEDACTFTDGKTYDSAKFILRVKDDDDLDTQDKKDLAAILRGIMDNGGTKSDGDKYSLYITRVETVYGDDGTTTVEESEYVDFEVPRYYSLIGRLESYAPKHTATFTLYPLKAGVDLAASPTLVADPDSYEDKASLTYELTQPFGTGLWQQDFSIKSSHLMKEDRSGQVYKLVVSKPGHVSYIWLGLELKPATLDVTGDLNCLTFTLDPDVNGGMIALIGGDIDGNGANGLEDLEIMTDIMAGEIPYNRETDKTKSGWGDSIRNPASLAYAADLDGDGVISAPDLRLLNAPRNFRQSAACYQAVMAQLKNASLGSVTGGIVLPLLIEGPLHEVAMELLIDLPGQTAAPKKDGVYAIDKDTVLTPVGPDNAPVGPDNAPVGPDNAPVGPDNGPVGPDDPGRPEQNGVYTIDKDTVLIPAVSDAAAGDLSAPSLRGAQQALRQSAHCLTPREPVEPLSAEQKKQKMLP